MLLACVQTDVAFARVDANRAVVADRVRDCAALGADLVVFPECVLCGYGFESREEAIESALTLADPAFEEFTSLAAESKLNFTLGFLRKDSQRLFNATALITPNGVTAVYDKVHLPHLGVDRFVDRGEVDFHVHTVSSPRSTEAENSDAADVRVGMAICYDSSFPEPMRVLGLAGADVIALGTNWPVAAARTARIVPPARSMENHLFFAAANRVGSERGFRYCGLSSICGPDGVELARAAGDEETILIAEIDPRQARNKRIERTPGKHVIDRFADRQTDFYASITDPSSWPPPGR